MRVTIKEVAKRAGVSPATVSLVLNRKPVPISEKTRDAVFQAAEELKYRPNQLAVGLVTNRSNSIGLILPDIENPFFAGLAKYIEQIAMEHGYAVITSSTNDDCISTCRYLRFLSDRQVDGVILAQSDFHSEAETKRVFKLTTDIHVPIVLVDRTNEEYDLPSVLVDQKKIGYLATCHLIEMGHTRIGCVTGPLGMYSTRERLAGYQQALSDYNIEYDKSLVYQGKYDIRTGSDSVPFLLGKGVSAVFCFADYIAFGVYRELRNLNRNIPEDLSIVGVDDTVLTDVIQPPLTTVAQPVSQIASLAVRQLVQQISSPNQSPSSPLFLEPNLKVRASVRRCAPY